MAPTVYTPPLELWFQSTGPALPLDNGYTCYIDTHPTTGWHREVSIFRETGETWVRLTVPDGMGGGTNGTEQTEPAGRGGTPQHWHFPPGVAWPRSVFPEDESVVVMSDLSRWVLHHRTGTISVTRTDTTPATERA